MLFKLSMITIREATHADSTLILDFIRQLAHYEKLSHEVVATVPDLERALFSARPAAEVLIAELDGKAAGFALFFPNYSTFLAKPGIYLEDLFVLPQLRGRGVGKKLFSRLAELALERNCGRLEWSVLDWNQPAIEFYKSLESKPQNEWTVWRLTGEALVHAGRGNVIK